MAFKDFMFRRKMAYEMKVMHDVNVTEWAALNHVNQGDMSHWLNGTREPRNPETIKKLATSKYIGPGVYSALGIIRLHDKILDRVVSNMEKLPPSVQEHYAAEIEAAAMTAEKEEAQNNFSFAAV